MATLPDLPSALIRVALADLAKVEAMPGTYAVDMYTYHQPIGANRCAVCLAGSVMAMSLGVSPSDYPSTRDFAERDKLQALNKFRTGSVEYGCDLIGIEVTKEFDRPITWYEDDRDAFRAEMEILASDLEAAGL